MTKMNDEDKALFLLSVVLSMYELARDGKMDNAAVMRVTESALQKVGLPSLVVSNGHHGGAA